MHDRRRLGFFMRGPCKEKSELPRVSTECFSAPPLHNGAHQIAFRRAHTRLLRLKSLMPTSPTLARRNFLKATTIVGGAVVGGAPMVAVAKPALTLRLQSTWSAKDIFHEYANDFAKKVNDTAGGRLKIDVLPAGGGQGV
jgi:hypothetical protein